MPVISCSILCYFHPYYGMNNDSTSRTTDYLLNKPNQHQFQIAFTTARQFKAHKQTELRQGFPR